MTARQSGGAGGIDARMEQRANGGASQPAENRETTDVGAGFDLLRRRALHEA